MRTREQPHRTIILGGGHAGVMCANRLVVDRYLRSTAHPGVLGAGDGMVIADPVGGHLRMACATAAPQGAHAAATAVAGLRGGPPAPFGLNYLVLAMSLGPGDGLVQATRGDDSPRDLVEGRRAG